MRCHYEVMEFTDMNVSIEEIKKKYKQLALIYHPDRNHGSEVEATQKFKELSNAYSVLNDPQERQWYDNHRDAILRGGDGTSNKDNNENDESAYNYFQYFNTGCFSGTDDNNPNSFYNVYGKVFNQIIQREINSSKQQKLQITIDISFGLSNTSMKDILSFYLYFENFVTILLFTHEDIYNTLEASNRATRRMMEKENQKGRDVARKEYIAQIRSLTSYVKKRDPRYINYENEMKQKKIDDELLKKKLKIESEIARKELRNMKKHEYENDITTKEQRDNERQRAFLLADNDEEDDDIIDIGYQSDNIQKEFSLQEQLRNMKLNENRFHRSTNHLIETENMLGATTIDNANILHNEDDNLDTLTINSTYKCEICEKEFKLELQLKQHLLSKPHLKKVKESMKSNKKKSK